MKVEKNDCGWCNQLTAVDKRVASGDPIKRITYGYQYWLATYRYYGGKSSDEAARYMRQQCKRARFSASR